MAAVQGTDRPIGWPVVLGAVLMAALGIVLRQSEPPLPGFAEQELFTQIGAAVFGLAALFLALGTLAHLLGLTLLRRRPERGESEWLLAPDDLRQLRLAGIWAIGWAITAALQTPFAGANSIGVPVRYAFTDLSSFLSGTQTTPTWLFTALGALVLGICCLIGRSWPSAIAGVWLSLLLSLPTVVTAQVSVGRDHDFATDAATIGTPAFLLAGAAAWAFLHRGDDSVAAATRTRRIVAVAGLLALLLRIGIGVFELAGTAPWASRYGIVMLIGLLLLAALPLTALGSWNRRRARIAVTLAGLSLGNQVALLALFPPRFRVPQTDQENYLGFNLPNPPMLPELLGPGRPNLLLATVALTAIVLYLLGWLRLRRRGIEWPVVRTICWALGWLLICYAATSGLWEYGSAMFSYHMLVHVTLNMLAPVLLVLGGPVTLALRVGHPAAVDGLQTVRDGVEAIMGWRVLGVLAHPLLVWAAFVGSLYVLYLTPLFDLGMRFHWSHQLMTFHFLITGFFYYAVVIGVDQPPRPLPHIARLGYVFAAMPFHAFFAVIVMSAEVIIGADFYPLLGLTWGPDLATDQELGGQLTWALGEFPLLVVVVALLIQWFRQDNREARRKDRAMDAGYDDAYEEYQRTLAALAEQDRRRESR
ncbi:cytochrome c oxidase assembly protein [Naumannella halotolerans]|uniref:cytochrome c oxidase assembly protein n=1 Tax=Naumannella halotolerans TaxID=993414 RepID=UPI00370D0159